MVEEATDDYGTGEEYFYHFFGQTGAKEVKATKRQIDNARAYFQQDHWEFPEGICAVLVFKSGSFKLSVDSENRQAGKKSIENVLKLPSPW